MSSIDTKLIILDFNKTIVNFDCDEELKKLNIDSKDHVKIESNLNTLLSDHGFVNQYGLKASLEHAYNNGYIIAIISYSFYPHAIQYILDQLQLDQILKNRICIITTTPKENNITNLKVKPLIRRVLNKFGILETLEATNIIFLYENQKNCEIAKDFKFITICTKDTNFKKVFNDEIKEEITLDPIQPPPYDNDEIDLNQPINWYQNLFNNPYFILMVDIALAIGCAAGIYLFWKNKFSSTLDNIDKIYNVSGAKPDQIMQNLQQVSRVERLNTQNLNNIFPNLSL